MKLNRAALASGRPGLSLMEVLVAIFIMGIGMLALLTLFPLGALRMEQSLRDERAAQAAVNARAVSRLLDLRNDSEVTPKFKNPGGTATDADNDKPSYAVLVDPAGSFNSSNTTALDTNRIARVKSSKVTGSTAPEFYNFFHLLDDIAFDRTGDNTAGAAALFGGLIGRQLLYSWAYLIQRPRFKDTNVANVNLCVFYRRPIAGQFETSYANSTMDDANNRITIQFATAEPPNIVPGQWLLDCTVLKDTSAPPKVTPLANFYRIIGVRENGTTKLDIDLQSRLLGWSGITAPQTNQGQVVILDSLIEVFDLGLGR